jgi:hypothetical protein
MKSYKKRCPYCNKMMSKVSEGQLQGRTCTVETAIHLCEECGYKFSWRSDTGQSVLEPSSRVNLATGYPKVAPYPRYKRRYLDYTDRVIMDEIKSRIWG